MNYPTSLPFDSMREIVSVLRAGTIVSEREAFAKNLWVLQGYVQGYLLGDPDATPTGGYALPQSLETLEPLPTELPALADVLEKMIDQEAVVESGGIAPQMLGVPMHWLLKLVLSQLVEILLKYIEARIA